MSTIRVSGLTLPLGGGGYLRLLPMAYTRWAIRRVHRKDRIPVIVYLHPWELDPEQPRLKGKWKSRLRHYVGLGRMEARLEEILRAGRFEPLADVVARMKASAPVFRACPS